MHLIALRIMPSMKSQTFTLKKNEMDEEFDTESEDEP